MELHSERTICSRYLRNWYHFIAVAFRRVVALNELTTTFNTNEILLAFSLAVLTNMGRVTFGALHCYTSLFIFLLCNAW